MKLLLGIILLVFALVGGLQKIALLNSYSEEAAIAYQQQQFEEAIGRYSFLVDSLQAEEDALRLNLAHSYWRAGQLGGAEPHYNILLFKSIAPVKSIAALQLGNTEVKTEQFTKALSYYRQALILNPDNEEARYNYELIKKYLEQNPEKQKQEEQKQQQQKQQQGSKEEQPEQEKEQQEEPKPQNKPDEGGNQQEETDQPKPADEGEENQQKQNQPKNSDQQSDKPQEDGSEKETQSGKEPGSEKGAGEEDIESDKKSQGNTGSGNKPLTEKDRQAQTQRERLKNLNLSEEKAKSILDAMQQAERQYLQQLPKKQSGEQQDKQDSKPQW